MEAYQFEGLYRDSYSVLNDSGTPIHYTSGAALNMNLAVLGPFYWDNRFHMENTEAQVRHVGWQWEGGLHLGPRIDLFQHHHSQHLMDMPNPRGDRYPLENYYGVRIHFITGEK